MTGGRPRVLLTALRADRSGGADAYTMRLSRELAARGFRVTVLCHEADPEVAVWCEVVRIPRSGLDHARGLWRLAPPWRLPHAVRAVRRAELAQPDVIVGGPDPVTFGAARRWRGVPLLNVPHSLVAPIEVAGYPWRSRVQRAAARWTYEYLEPWVMRRAARTVRFTRFGCDALTRYYGRRVPRRFAVLPAPIDVPAPSSRPPSAMRILFVGRLVPSKNVALLVRALAGAKAAEWAADIVGDGSERSALERAAADAGLAGRIVFHGQQADVDRFYRSAGLLAFPSRLESFGMVPLEAMAHGVPVLAVRDNGSSFRNPFHEWIGPETGFLAESEEAFARRLAELVSQPDALARVGAAARAAVSAQTWADHAARYQRLFAEIGVAV